MQGCTNPAIGLPGSPPTPLLMIVALADNITLTNLQLRAYEQMLEPKKLATVEGDTSILI